MCVQLLTTQCQILLLCRHAGFKMYRLCFSERKGIEQLCSRTTITDQSDYENNATSKTNNDIKYIYSNGLSCSGVERWRDSVTITVCITLFIIIIYTILLMCIVTWSHVEGPCTSHKTMEKIHEASPWSYSVIRVFIFYLLITSW